MPDDTKLREGLEESWSAGEGEKQKDLTNLTFTIYSCDRRQFYKDDGDDDFNKPDEERELDREAFLVDLLIRGETALRRFWMGGKTFRQVEWMDSEGLFPCVLKQIREEGKGQPYKLIIPPNVDTKPDPRPEGPVATPAATSTAEPAPAPDTTPQAIDVGGKFDEAVMFADKDEGAAQVVGVLSDAGLDDIMEMDATGTVTIKAKIKMVQTVKATKILDDFIATHKQS